MQSPYKVCSKCFPVHPEISQIDAHVFFFHNENLICCPFAWYNYRIVWVIGYLHASLLNDKYCTQIWWRILDWLDVNVWKQSEQLWEGIDKFLLDSRQRIYFA